MVKEDLLRYLRARRVHRAVPVAIVLTIIALFLGRMTVYIPSVSAASAPVSLAVLIPIAFACTITTYLRSALSTFEEAGARLVWRWEVAQVGIGTLLCAAALTGALWVGGARDLVPIALRGLAYWIGVALITGRIAGWALSWVGPVALAGVYGVCGFDAAGQARIWATPLYDVRSAAAGIVTMVALTVGVLMVTCARIASFHWRSPRKRSDRA